MLVPVVVVARLGGTPGSPLWLLVPVAVLVTIVVVLRLWARARRPAVRTPQHRRADAAR